MKKILLANLASPANPGDQAILLGSLKLLRSTFGPCEITLTTREFSERRVYEALGCRVIPDYPDAEAIATDSVAGKILNIPKAFANPKPLSDAVAQADLVFLAGGGYLYSYRRLMPGIGFLAHLTPIFWASKRRKPVFILPHSYGPIEAPLTFSLFDSAMRKTDVGFYREDVSGDWLKKRYPEITSRFVFMPDLALNLDRSDLLKNETVLNKNSKGRIGVTVRPWRAGNADEQNYLNELAKVLSEMHSGTGASVRIIPQVQDVKAAEGDALPSKQLYEKLSAFIGSANVELCVKEPYFQLDEICKLYAECDLMISMRLHSALLSYVLGRPAIVVGYQHKAQGILKSLKLEELYAGNFDQVSASGLKEKCVRVWKERELWEGKISQAVKEAKHQIREAFDREIRRKTGKA